MNIKYYVFSIATVLCISIALSSPVDATTLVSNPSAGKPANDIAQNKAQDKIVKKSKEGEMQAMMKGMMSIAQGVQKIQIGNAKNASSKCGCAGIPDIIQGIFKIAQGIKGLNAGAKMGGNAAKAQSFSNQLNCTGAKCNGTLAVGIKGTGINGSGSGSKTGGASLNLDPRLLKKGPLADELAKLSKTSGIPRDKLLGMLNGKDPKSILAGFQGMPKGGALDKMISGANSKLASDAKLAGSLKSEHDKAMDAALKAYQKDGLLGENFIDENGAGGLAGGIDGNGGKDPTAAMNDILNNQNASATAGICSIAEFTNKGDCVAHGGVWTDSNNLDPNGLNKVSSDVLSSLDKNGISEKSVFELVTTHYKEVSPMMFGERSPASLQQGPQDLL